MTTKSFEYGQTFRVGDVVQGSFSNFSREILSRVFIEELQEYRFILQSGTVKENKFEPSTDGKDLVLYSTKEIRDNYSKFWTADKATVKKGDVFKDDSGNFYVVESADGKAWSLTNGTWAAIKIDADGRIIWSSHPTVRLTEAKTLIGDKFSKHLG